MSASTARASASMATRVEVAKEASARIGRQRSRVELDINRRYERIEGNHPVPEVDDSSVNPKVCAVADPLAQVWLRVGHPTRLRLLDLGRSPSSANHSDPGSPEHHATPSAALHLPRPP